MALSLSMDPKACKHIRNQRMRALLNRKSSPSPRGLPLGPDIADNQPGGGRMTSAQEEVIQRAAAMHDQMENLDHSRNRNTPNYTCT